MQMMMMQMMMMQMKMMQMMMMQMMMKRWDAYYDDTYDADDAYEIAKEISDVLWYAANLANDIGYSLEEIAMINLLKLSSRKERNQLSGSGDNRWD